MPVVTVKELAQILLSLPENQQGAAVCVGSCCGVHYIKPIPEVELARFKADDPAHRDVAVDYFPEAEQDPDDDALFGPRQKVVILR